MKTKNLVAALQNIPQRLKSAIGPWYPFHGQGEHGSWFQLGPLEDGFQRNLEVDKRHAARFGPVYSCIAILAQELSRIPLTHYRILEDGRREVVTNKAPIRLFRKPNRYQTKSDWILYLMYSLLTEGNAYSLAIRNDRNEIAYTYPMNPWSTKPYILDGEVFYRHGNMEDTELAGIENDLWIPARDMVHVRVFCPLHPLIGETPIKSVLNPITSGVLINTHNANFFGNMSRPSGVLRHPGALSEEAMQRIKQRFMEITQRHHTGEPVVLQENMEWKPLTMSAVDAELISSYRLSERQIAQVYRVPPFLLGDLEKATFQNVESLSRFFVQSSLGFYINHFENALTAFFNLPPDEHIVFEVEKALLRGDFESRMNAYAKGIQSGVYAPNEARAREYLPPVEYGDDPRVQQQLVPLSYGVNLQPKNSINPQPDSDSEPTDEEEIAAMLVARKAIEKAMS